MAVGLLIRMASWSLPVDWVTPTPASPLATTRVRLMVGMPRWRLSSIGHGGRSRPANGHGSGTRQKWITTAGCPLLVYLRKCRSLISKTCITVKPSRKLRWFESNTRHHLRLHGRDQRKYTEVTAVHVPSGSSRARPATGVHGNMAGTHLIDFRPRSSPGIPASLPTAGGRRPSREQRGVCGAVFTAAPPRGYPRTPRCRLARCAHPTPVTIVRSTGCHP